MARIISTIPLTMSASNEIFSGHYFNVVHAEFPEDKVAEVVEGIKPLLHLIKSGGEPGTLEFRAVRFENKFVIFEEYENLAAQLAHRESEEYKKFMPFARSIATKLEYKYYEEI